MRIRTQIKMVNETQSIVSTLKHILGKIFDVEYQNFKWPGKAKQNIAQITNK